MDLMSGELYSIIYGAVGGGVTGVIAAVLGAVAIAYFKRVMSERDKLAEARMVAIENEIREQRERFEEHVKIDDPGGVSVSLQNLRKAIEESMQIQRHNEIRLGEIDKKVSGLNERMEAEVKAKDIWLANINNEVQKHITNGSIHRYGN